MELICLDLEGVLVPEIWIAVSEKIGLRELRLTTRDISEYDELMNHRLGILKRAGIYLKDIQNIIETLEPLDGALDFIRQLRRETQVVILSDTFEQFAAPLMRKLELPTMFCNTLLVEESGRVFSYQMRQNDGKRKAVEAFRSMGLRVFAAGDSYNDITMLKAAHRGMLFRAPEAIKEEFPNFTPAETHQELLIEIRDFVNTRPVGVTIK